ncbi:acyl-CoA thioesterase II [Blastococcus sp. TF02A-30]|uniref:acyl-CoA thioesterase n=1 Tax=Blastococcus sp. TF02A-30 TaxID=2250580 RepID=UPI000DE90023|nr:thioesterase family protein [Blastococcus sp. TF02A-30]RBY83398.1 thioesterase family protein [Blastococcus sp. TF02A-30]
MPQNDQPSSAFDVATAVRRAEGPVLVADLDPTWEVGGGILNGGYLLSVAGRAAVLDSPHEHPVAMSASYLRAASGGPATLTVTPGPAGRTLAHSLITLADDGGPVITVQATTATLGDEAPEYSEPAPEVAGPDECIDMAEHADKVPVPVQLPGLTRHVQSRLDPATALWALGQPQEEPVLRAWVRLADGRPADPLALLTFADVLPPTGFALGRTGWAPTVQLQVLVRALPAPGWCLVEARSSEIAGGWVDEDYRVWDSTGRLVAQSRQLARAARQR